MLVTKIFIHVEFTLICKRPLIQFIMKFSLKKLEYYGIKGTTYNWFQSFLCGRMQFTQIKDSESSLKTISHSVPQSSVLGPLLFIIFINDMHNSIEHSKMHHYADDTNLLLTDNSLKKINKYVNHDLSLLCH